MLNGFTTLLIPHGYGLVFFLILLESAGLPLPGETLLVLAAALASRGHLSITGVILCATLGAILGDMGGYWIGRRGGAILLKRILGKNYEGHISKGRTFFNRYGASAVFLARFIPGVRVVGANLAGMTEMPFSTFTLFNAAGGLTWAVTMGGLGYIFGNNLPYLESILRRLGAGMFILICIIIVAIFASRQISRHEKEIRAWLSWLKQSLVLQRFQSWLAGKYQSKRVLAVSLGGLLLAILSGWIFGALAEDVLSRDSTTLYDIGVSRWLLSLATEDSSQFFFLVTLLGSTWFIFTASLLISSWLAWRRQWSQLGTLILSVGGGILLNLLLKNIFLRPRPDFPNVFYHESGYSFPSGHAMLSVLFYGMTAYLFAGKGFSWNTQIRSGITAFTLSLLIGFSRLLLGVHYLTDVLGGWAAGLTWLITCVFIYEMTASHSKAALEDLKLQKTM